MKLRALILWVWFVGCAQKPMPPPDLPPACEEPMADTCAGAACGQRVNRCGLVVSCGDCAGALQCVDGRCVAPPACVPDVMGACALRECGVRDDGCDGGVSCGSCSPGLTCTAEGRCSSSDAGLPDAGYDAGVPGFTCPVTRVTLDRPDESSLPRVRMMYVIPSDVPDESLDVNGRVCQSAQAFAAWLYGQVGRTLRFDVANGELDVGFLRLNKTNAQMRGSSNANDVNTGVAYVRERIERELRASGAIAPDKLYAVFYGGESTYACGGAAYPPALIGQVIAMYLKSTIGGVSCESRPWGQASLELGYFDWAMLHDLMHGLGVVPNAAPHHHSFGHAYDPQAPRPEVDLMYSPRLGQADPGWAIDAPGGLVLDLNHDDYYAHDAGFVDLRRSAFLEPLPPDAMRPPGW